MIAVHANVQTSGNNVQVFLMHYRNNAPLKAIILDVRAHLDIKTKDWLLAEVVIMYYDRNGYNTRNKYVFIEKGGEL